MCMYLAELPNFPGLGISEIRTNLGECGGQAGEVPLSNQRNPCSCRNTLVDAAHKEQNGYLDQFHTANTLMMLRADN